MKHIISLCSVFAIISANTAVGQTIYNTTGFYNCIITDSVVINSTDTLHSSHILVDSTGVLTINSRETVVIVGDFYVVPGGTLTINGAQRYAVTYYYDNSGNRIRRRRLY